MRRKYFMTIERTEPAATPIRVHVYRVAAFNAIQTGPVLYLTGRRIEAAGSWHGVCEDMGIPPDRGALIELLATHPEGITIAGLPYVYDNNNPASNFDPSGNCPIGQEPDGNGSCRDIPILGGVQADGCNWSCQLDGLEGLFNNGSIFGMSGLFIEPNAIPFDLRSQITSQMYGNLSGCLQPAPDRFTPPSSSFSDEFALGQAIGSMSVSGDTPLGSAFNTYAVRGASIYYATATPTSPFNFQEANTKSMQDRMAGNFGVGVIGAGAGIPLAAIDAAIIGTAIHNGHPLEIPADMRWAKRGDKYAMEHCR
jgi:hypothetical protein